MNLQIQLPVYVQTAARVLVKEGFKVYLAGGAIRDTLQNIKPKDFDLYTNALPEEMLKIFTKSVAVGQKFGTIIALQYDEHGESYEVEITTFRKEAQYLQGRWPSKVEFIGDIETDLARRDFTINAMAINLNEHGLANLETHLGRLNKLSPKEFTLIDLFGGIKDMNNKLIKAVGNPLERFQEDGVRAYKACRLASQLRFTIDPATFKAISKSLTVAQNISVERIRDEFHKLIMNSTKPSHGIELLRQTGLLKFIIPELLEGRNVEQKIGHSHDVYKHALHTVDKATDRIKIAALLHDIAKPRCDTKNGHFYGHDVMGAKMTKEILLRLRYSKKEAIFYANLVRWHMFYYPEVEEHFTKTTPKLNTTQHKKTSYNRKKRTKDQPFWSDAAVRRFLQRVGSENIEELFELRIADAMSNPASLWNPQEIELLQKRIAKIRQADMAMKVTDLHINGHDLIELGVPKGPQIGLLLQKLLHEVTENPNLNNKEKLKMLINTKRAKAI